MKYSDELVQQNWGPPVRRSASPTTKMLDRYKVTVHAPSGGEALAYNATRYQVDARGSLALFDGGDLLVLFAPNRWSRFELTKLSEESADEPSPPSSGR